MKRLVIFLMLICAVPAFASDFEYVYATGAKALTATLTTTAVANNGDGTVKLTFGAAHGFLAPSILYVSGTTNYDGMRYVTSIPSSTTINIRAPYVAETPGGTETVSVALAPNFDGELISFEIHLSSASATSENLTITNNANAGAAYDVNILTKDMNTVQDYIRKFHPPDKFLKGDLIQLVWANSNSRTWGIMLKYRRVQ